MPLYMDVHKNVAGASEKDVAGAHDKDVEVGKKYGVRYLKYWHDPQAGKVFCLIDSPDPDLATKVHREAHGLLADEIYQVEEHG